MAMNTGVVLVRTGATYRVYTDWGEVTAVLRGKLRRREDDRVVAGDVVELELQRDGLATISCVRPRRSVLARRAAGARSPRVQPLAANVDQVVVVAAARDPEPNLRMLDRFLVVAEGNGIPPVIVLNKIELERSAEQAFQRRFGPAGYQVLATSVKAVTGLPALRGPAGGAGRELRPRPAGLLRAHLRGGQRSFLVQRSASRALTFCIIAANA